MTQAQWDYVDGSNYIWTEDDYLTLGELLDVLTDYADLPVLFVGTKLSIFRLCWLDNDVGFCPFIQPWNTVRTGSQAAVEIMKVIVPTNATERILEDTVRIRHNTLPSDRRMYVIADYGVEEVEGKDALILYTVNPL